MDDEDKEQMKEDRRLENTDTFKGDGFGGTKEELEGKGYLVSLALLIHSATAALQSLIAPARSSIGETLLKKLGWRPGQGIGPRVSLRKLKIQEGKLGKIRAGMAIEEDDVDLDGDVVGTHTFAPRDAKLLVFEGKEDKQGLGFEKGKGMGALPGKKHVGPGA
jgi:G patch domain-containing protein 1